MRVVVTGATGFMGGRLCAALAAAGHDVRAFALPGVDVSGLPPAVEVAYGDVTDEESLVASFSGCDAVFHAAAAVEAWLPDPSAFHTVRYSITLMVLVLTKLGVYGVELHLLTI
jgi:farnesol dehydrogenase